MLESIDTTAQDMPRRMWEDDWFDESISKGFLVLGTLPIPKSKPSRRRVKRWQPTYDWVQEEMPWKTESDHRYHEEYNRYMTELRRVFGSENVLTIRLTDAMRAQTENAISPEPQYIVLVRSDKIIHLSSPTL